MKLLQALRREQSGNVLITFAVCFAGLVLALGVAIDYSFATFQRSELQKAADAAALAAAKLPSTDKQAAEDEAKRFFQGNDGSRVSPSVSVGAETVTVEGAYAQPTFILHVFGHEQVNIAARAVAARGQPKRPCVLILEKVEK